MLPIRGFTCVAYADGTNRSICYFYRECGVLQQFSYSIAAVRETSKTSCCIASLIIYVMADTRYWITGIEFACKFSTILGLGYRSFVTTGVA